MQVALQKTLSESLIHVICLGTSLQENVISLPVCSQVPHKYTPIKRIRRLSYSATTLTYSTRDLNF